MCEKQTIVLVGTEAQQLSEAEVIVPMEVSCVFNVYNVQRKMDDVVSIYLQIKVLP